MIEIPHPLASTAMARPAHPALITAEGTLSAAALAQAAARRAAGLAASGVGPGSVVALYGPASSDWVVSFHAIGWLGATAAPLGSQSTVSEIEAAARALAPTHALASSDLPAAINERLEASLGARLLQPDDARPPLAERFWPLEERRVVVLTSGTTGAPRPVALTTAQLVFSAFGSALRLGHLPSDRWLACLPLHHVGGLSILVRCALYGTTVQLERGFDPVRVTHLLDDGTVTLASLVPAMLARLLEARGDRPFPPTLRALLVGGAPTPPALVARCRALGAPLALTWGMSETASQVATGFAGEMEPEGAAGPPLAFARVDRITGDRLRVRGPLAPAGELVTADCGFVDDAGRIHPVARTDDVIISGGEKIAPEEVEAVLGRHPAVAEAAVVGIPDARWGERPIALCVAKPGAAAASDDEMRAHCRAELVPYKIPDRVVWVAKLARNDLGKLSRTALRAGVSSILANEQSRPGERRGELAGKLARSTARTLDADMHEHHAGAQGVVLTPQLVNEAHRAVAGLGEEHLDPQPLSEVDGAHEVGLGVDDRQRPGSAAKEGIDAPQAGGDELLESGMAVLENTAEKKDAGAIDLEETRRDATLEGHGFPREKQPERSGDARS